MKRDARKSNESYLKFHAFNLNCKTVHATNSERTQNANKGGRKRRKKAQISVRGGGEGIRVGEVGVRYERAAEISRFPLRPCSEIYIFGAKGEKEEEEEEGGGKVNESFSLTPARGGRARTKPAKDSISLPPLREFQWEPRGRITLPQCVVCCPCSRSTELS